MKKFRVLCLAFILAFAGIIFASCKKEEIVLSQNISLSETEVELSFGESIEVFVTISPENTTQKEFEIIGEYLDVAEIECDFENMKIVVTARDFVTADITEALVGIRTLDESKKEAHLNISLVEEHQEVAIPQNLSYDGENIVWNAVENAKNYTIEIDGEQFTWSQPNFFLDLDEYAGKTINVRVKANGKSSNLDSEFSDYITFTILNRPTGLAYNDEAKKFTWNALENAEAYTVQINNRQFVVNTNEFNVESYLNVAGQYQIRVKANTNEAGNILNSAFSNSLIITKLAAPNDPSIQNERVIWNSVIGAIAYEVQYNYSSNGVAYNETFTTTSTVFLLPKDIDVGTYSLKIRSIGNGKTTLSSDFGIERNYTKLAPVQNLRVENGSVVWTPNNDATSYTIYFENVIAVDGNKMTDSVSQTSGADIVSYDISSYPAGEYKIDIVANGLSDKISSEKTGEPITVVKLAAPKNFQINKVNGESIIQWDAVENASAYRLILNHYEDGGADVEITVDDLIVVKRIITQGLVVGPNYANVKAIGSGEQNGVWYINSDYTDDISVVKLATPSINMSDALNGNISWTSSNSQGFESYTVSIYTASGVKVDNITVSQNKYNLNGLAEGDYILAVRTNATENSSFYSSEFTQFVQIHKFGISALSVQNGTILDLEGNQEENFTYRYYISNRAAPVSSINSYVENSILSGAKVSVYAQKIPYQSVVDGVYFVASNPSNVLYIQKLPTINSVSMVNGILSFGSEYANMSGFKFNIVLNDTETIENSTNRTYDFNNINPGDYSVKINAVSVQEGEGTISSETNPLFINSYTPTNAYTFKKLGSPSNLKIANYVNDQNVSALALLNALDTYSENSSGVLKWEGVDFATEYELNFDDGTSIIKTSSVLASLQNIAITSGVHTVKIRAIGNGTNVISSEFATESGSVVTLEFTKLSTPTELKIENGKIKWSYSNLNDDPNKNLGEINILNLQNNDLFKDGSSVAVYFLIDNAGKIYNTIDISDLDFENDTMASINAMISRLKSNECDLPEGINGTSTLKVFSYPLNSYISDVFNFVASANSVDKRFVKSDYSNGLNLIGLETPLDFKVENYIVSWSGLRYNVENSDKPLKGYEITISRGNSKFVFDVREDASKIYEINTAEKVVYIDDLSNSQNCYWNFNKQNFEAFFGAGSYLPGNYSISIKSIANNSSSFTDDSGKVYYYCNGYSSTAVSVEVLANPVLRVEKGIIVWDAISNISGYHLYISQNQNIAETDEYLIIDKETTSFELGSYYPAGDYYFKIVAIGEGSEVFTAEFADASVKQFTKLATITGLAIQNGILKYDANSIIGTENDGKSYHYTMFIRKTGQEENADIVLNNEKYTSFELGTNFAGGNDYMIRVQATGDSTKYLNSDLSAYYLTQNGKYPTKLTSPVRAYISNGLIYWTVVSNAAKYKITLSGQSNIIINTINTYYDISSIPAGTYSVGIKGIGDSNFLNSDATEITNVVKLADIENLNMENGYIVWDNVSNSNYVANINGIDVAISGTQAFVNNGKVYYALDGYQSGEYNIYLYNFGGNNAISSSKTTTYTFTKLESPTNLKVEFDEDDGADYLIFDAVENKTKYFLNITAKFANRSDVLIQIEKLNESDITQNIIRFDDIVSYVDAELLKQNISTPVSSYQICIVAIGSSGNLSDGRYVTSNNSESLIVTRPSQTTVTAVYTSSDEFSGKIVWNAVENADYYKVYVKCIEDQSKAVLFNNSVEVAEDSEHLGYRVYKVSKTQANLVYNGSYSIIVVACQNKNGYNSIDSNVVDVEYSMFGIGQNGSEINPYLIQTIEQFNAMQYNLYANYLLDVSELEITLLETIGTQSEMFEGVFNGNGATITLNIPATDNKFVGLFAYVGENGKIHNFNINANIYSVAQMSGAIKVASVACINYGTIQNIIVSGTISTEYNLNSINIYNAGVACENYGTISHVLSKASVLPKNNSDYVYAGGIVAINNGTIEKSGFVGVASAQMVGGIAAQNLGGTIDQCYYQNSADNSISTQISSVNNGSSHNYAGGLVGFMQNGKITSSYAKAKVFGASYGSTSGNSAYVGGLVGYVESIDKTNGEGIQGCYVVGYDGSNLIDAMGTYSYAGVFVGDNKVDSSVGGLICIKAESQSYIGNSLSPFANVVATVDNIESRLNLLGSVSSNFSSDATLKHAIYESNI